MTGNKHAMGVHEQTLADRISTLILERSGEMIPSDKLEVGSSPYGYHPVYLKAGALKPPFHKRVQTNFYLRGKNNDDELWNGVGNSIVRLKREHADLCDELRRMISKTIEICTRWSMALKSYTITSVGFSHIGRPVIDIVAEITMIDESLNTRDVSVPIMGKSKQVYNSLVMQGKAQEYRARRREDGFVTNKVMMNALKHHNEHNLFGIEREIRRVLEKNPNEKTIESELYRRLREKRMIDPEVIRTIAVVNGEIRGRVKLSEDISFNRYGANIKMILPQSLVANAEGRKLNEIIDHPWIPDDAVITRITERRKESTSIEVECPRVIFPSGYEESGNGKEPNCHQNAEKPDLFSAESNTP